MPKTAGYLLCAWGKVGYGYAAFNAGASIRFYSPDAAITLITDGHAIAHLSDQHKAVFSDIIVTGEAVTDPGGFKTSLYDRLPYDYTLYLDVDVLCVQPLEPLMERLIAEFEADPYGKYYRTHIYDWYDENSPVDMPMMYWARRDVIWDTYGFTNEKFPATQSSIQFIAKSPQAENFYKMLNHIYVNDYIPLESLKHKWGGTQPDELYLNVTIAKLGIDPQIGKVMWFCDNGNLKPHQAKLEYFLFSYFGVRKRIKALYVTYYDQSITKMFRTLGFTRVFKSHSIFAHKHANTFVSPRKAERDKMIAEAPLAVKAASEVWESELGKRTIHLFTTYYKATTAARQYELNACIIKNCENPFISKVFVLCENIIPEYTHRKLTAVLIGRQTMKEVVDFANQNSGDINIMCNSDIYCNESIGMVQDLNIPGRVLCLSRWEQLANGSLKHYSYEYSQDTWIWEGQLKINGGDYRFGLLGCDNKFAHDVWASGYEIFNPSRHIKTIHVHLSNVRNYSEASRLPRPYRNVPVCMIDALIQEEVINA